MKRSATLGTSVCLKTAIISAWMAFSPTASADGCPNVYRPVCGENGQTYMNRCESRAAQVDIEHRGVCRGSASAQPRHVVPSSAPASRSAPVARTYPTQRAAAEPRHGTQYDPVCGADGETYRNRYNAMQSGVKILWRGVCAPNDAVPNAVNVPKTYALGTKPIPANRTTTKATARKATKRSVAKRKRSKPTTYRSKRKTVARAAKKAPVRSVAKRKTNSAQKRLASYKKMAKPRQSVNKRPQVKTQVSRVQPVQVIARPVVRSAPVQGRTAPVVTRHIVSTTQHNEPVRLPHMLPHERAARRSVQPTPTPVSSLAMKPVTVTTTARPVSTVQPVTFENRLRGKLDEEAMTSASHAQDTTFEAPLSNKPTPSKLPKVEGRRIGYQAVTGTSDPNAIDPAERPCSDHYAPVCGKNGREYANSCIALSIGVGIANQGHCDKPSAIKLNQPRQHIVATPVAETFDPAEVIREESGNGYEDLGLDLGEEEFTSEPTVVETVSEPQTVSDGQGGRVWKY